MLALAIDGFGHEWPANKIEVFAKISARFLFDRIGTPVAAIMGQPPIIAGAVQTNTHVRSATLAGFASPGQPGNGPFPAAIVTMARHGSRVL